MSAPQQVCKYKHQFNNNDSSHSMPRHGACAQGTTLTASTIHDDRSGSTHISQHTPQVLAPPSLNELCEPVTGDTVCHNGAAGVLLQEATTNIMTDSGRQQRQECFFVGTQSLSQAPNSGSKFS